MEDHIGIVACSAEGAALCYRTIVQEGERLLGPYEHPEISMHSLPLAAYVRCIERDDWRGVGELMLESTSKLQAVGARFVICPDNTIHQALPLVRAQSPLPWLHIAEVVAEEALRRGFRRIGILGTAWLVDSEVYPQALAGRSLEWMRPSAAERDEGHRIIMDELVKHVLRPEAEAHYAQVMRRMMVDGCDAVVLGCTEIPLVMHEGNSPLPILDSTRLLARAAVRSAIGVAERPVVTSDVRAHV
jgi:aspartate racemase